MYFVCDGVHSSQLGLYLLNYPIVPITNVKSSNAITDNGQVLVFNPPVVADNNQYKYASKERVLELECTLVCDRAEDHVARINGIIELFKPGVEHLISCSYLPSLACKVYLNGPITDILTRHNPKLTINLVSVDPRLIPFNYSWPAESEILDI